MATSPPGFSVVLSLCLSCLFFSVFFCVFRGHPFASSLAIQGVPIAAKVFCEMTYAHPLDCQPGNIIGNPRKNESEIPGQKKPFSLVPNPSPTAPQPLPNRSPTDTQPIPNRSPTAPQPIPNRSPTDTQPIPNRYPTDTQPIPWRATHVSHSIQPSRCRFLITRIILFRANRLWLKSCHGGHPAPFMGGWRRWQSRIATGKSKGE
jgi:hypothetical protein